MLRLASILCLVITSLSGPVVFAENSPIVIQSIELNDEAITEIKTQQQADSAVKICDTLSVTENDLSENRINVADKILKLCDVLSKRADSRRVRPPRLYTTISSVHSRTTNSRGNDPDYGTTHLIDVNYSGVPIFDRPPEKGSLTFEASLDTAIEGGIYTVSGRFLRNFNDDIYNPQQIPDGLTLGAGAWLSDSQSYEDSGLLFSANHRSTAKNSDERLKTDLRFKLSSNNRALGRSSKYTANIGIDRIMRFNDTVHDIVVGSIDIQHDWLKPEGAIRDKALLGVISVKASTQFLSTIFYPELGFSVFKAFDHPEVESSTEHFIYFAAVFRMPLAAKSSGMGTFSNNTGLTKLGSSSSASKFWDRLYVN